MKKTFNPELKGFISLDEKNVVRYIDHSQKYWMASENNPRKLAFEYLRKMASTYSLQENQMKNLHQYVDFLNPTESEIGYRISEEKTMFDSTTYGFYQTYHNVPLWRSGLSVTVKHNPSRVVSSSSQAHLEISAKLPEKKLIDDFSELFNKINVSPKNEESERDHSAEMLDKILNFKSPSLTSMKRSNAELTNHQQARAKINRGRFFIYQYDSKKRQHDHANDPVILENGGSGESEFTHPTLPLPNVHSSINNGQYYLVVELMFTYYLAPFGNLNWRALVDVNSNSILYLRALIDGANGFVFEQDPITSTGILSNDVTQTNAVLNPVRDDVVLPNLDAPIGGTESLNGTWVTLSDDRSPTIAPPTQSTGTDFDYDVRSNEFAAVSAYFHSTNVFATIEDLGFPLNTYFNRTTFPIHVDHRGFGGGVNAACGSNTTGDGIGLVRFGLGHSNTSNGPIGRAVDKYVHWHEIGGHGVLWDHVESPNFGFAHSAGDALAAIQNDPTSQLRSLPERFWYAPFRQLRRFDQDVTSGAAWGGANDSGGYPSEPILATTLFRLYRSIGGDSNSLSRRIFASRMASYLILRAIGNLTPGTNPSNALGFCNELIAADLLNWTSEGIYGGAYNKVIRWAFEKQGLFQPVGAPTPVVSEGDPPAVDVYIDDGRNGEYQFQHVHWNTTTIWNRNTSDGLAAHQTPILGQTNYAYVKIKNRGTADATDGIVVKGYHCLPGAGLNWPNDFNQMGSLAGLPITSIGANDSEEVVVGPFEWAPNVNTYGHDCMLMIVSADGDPSNIDNFTTGESTPEWRLVPHDNNVGQRNVNLMPGGGGEGLVRGMNEVIFYAGNTSRRRADMALKVQLPAILEQKGWTIFFKGTDKNIFQLDAGERRKIVIQVSQGQDFSKDEIYNTLDRDILISLYADDALVGGMTYRLDPTIKDAINLPETKANKCHEKASDLLECLNLGNKKVSNVCVKKISLDIEMDTGCSC